MQSSAATAAYSSFSSSSSSSNSNALLLRRLNHRRLSNKTFIFSHPSIRTPSSPPSLVLCVRGSSSSSSSSSSIHGHWDRSPVLLSNLDPDPTATSPAPATRRRTASLGFQASAIAEGTAGAGDVDDSEFESSSSSESGRLLVLGVLFTFWFLFNIYFNIFNKQVLKVYPFPLTVSAFQFGVGTVLVLVMWSTNLYRRPLISSQQLLAILPLAIVHTLGNLFTNMSLGQVSVSFTHTVKAMEPFFSVFLSAIFLAEAPTMRILSSLVPIVGGVALASLTEVSFNWAGFWSAMASNLTNQSRNVLSKKLMVKKEESVDNITLFSVITVMSFFLSVPVALFFEGVSFTPSYIQSTGLNLKEIYTRSLLAALCYHTYQQVAYMILARVSPVSHSVANCVKRVVVIVSAVLFFRTPVSPLNSFGTAVALAGVFLYSRAKRIKSKAS